MKVDMLVSYLGYPIYIETPDEHKADIPFLQTNFRDFIKRGEYIEVDPILMKLCGVKTKTIKKI